MKSGTIGGVKVLVTGGAGYIGSHACKLLSERGHEVVVFDNLEKGHRELLRWGTLIEGDLRKKSDIAQAVAKSKPDAVFHFASYIEVGESVLEPDRYYENNVNGSLHLFSALVEAGVRDVVFSSSAAVYGSPRAGTDLISESHEASPINPYGKFKWEVEKRLSELAERGALRSTCLRYFNAAGADPDGQTGEWHEPESHLIPIVLEVASGKRPRVEIFGNDYDTEDGTCQRDYVHVTDLAEAHLLALAHQQGSRQIKGPAHQVFNLGSDRGYSVLEVIEEARLVTGKKIETRISERRPGDPARLVASSARAREVLDWRPQHGQLSKIIETAWGWSQKLSQLKGKTRG